jgi:hypothetical protein
MCRAYLNPKVANALDCVSIHRFAPKLNFYQLENACRWLAGQEGLDTERFIGYLQSKNIASDVKPTRCFRAIAG